MTKKKKKILNVNLSTVTIIIIIIILYNLSSLIDMKMKRLHLRFDLSVWVYKKFYQIPPKNFLSYIILFSCINQFDAFFLVLNKTLVKVIVLQKIWSNFQSIDHQIHQANYSYSSSHIYTYELEKKRKKRNTQFQILMILIKY